MDRSTGTTAASSIAVMRLSPAVILNLMWLATGLTLTPTSASRRVHQSRSILRSG